jgi:hypothetical protein
MTPKEAASAAELARVLRERLFRGDFGEDGLMPSRMELKRPGVSAETASVALRMLAAEGLIRIEQGKRSVVLPLRTYATEVIVPHDGVIGGEALAKADRRVRVQADDDPAIGEVLSVANAGKRLRIWLAVTAADSGRAAARVMAIAAYACPAADGWEITGASVTARPA